MTLTSAPNCTEEGLRPGAVRLRGKGLLPREVGEATVRLGRYPIVTHSEGGAGKVENMTDRSCVRPITGVANGCRPTAGLSFRVGRVKWYRLPSSSKSLSRAAVAIHRWRMTCLSQKLVRLA